MAEREGFIAFFDPPTPRRIARHCPTKTSWVGVSDEDEAIQKELGV
jgi:hypothetical protein